MSIKYSICAAAFALTCAGKALSAPAEYAIRWSPEGAQPKTIAEVWIVLGLDAKKKVEVFDVRYFDAPNPPSDAPKGATAIVRERKENSGPDVTWKYRSEDELGEPPVWRCPLAKVGESKFEVDISFLESSARKKYSWSCSTPGTLASLIPSTLIVVPLGCGSQMTRSEAKGVGYRVELWQLKDGSKILEVSWTATDGVGDEKVFRKDVVDKLMSRIKPLDRTKTEIVSRC